MKKSFVYGIGGLALLLVISALCVMAAGKDPYCAYTQTGKPQNDTAWSNTSIIKDSAQVQADTSFVENYYDRSKASVDMAQIAGKMEEIAESAETDAEKVQKAKALYQSAVAEVKKTDIPKLRKELLAVLNEKAEESSGSLEAYMENSFGMSLKEFRESVMKEVAEEEKQ